MSFRSHAKVIDAFRPAGYDATLRSAVPHRRLLIAPGPSCPGTTEPSWHQALEAVLDPRHPVVALRHREANPAQDSPLEALWCQRIAQSLHARLCGTNDQAPNTPSNVRPPPPSVPWDDLFATRLGIVTPYHLQGVRIARALALSHGIDPDTARRAVDTVERYQGQERDVIVLSMSAGDPETISNEETFLLDAQRINVALSRARCKIVILIHEHLCGHVARRPAPRRRRTPARPRHRSPPRTPPRRRRRRRNTHPRAMDTQRGSLMNPRYTIAAHGLSMTPDPLIAQIVLETLHALHDNHADGTSIAIASRNNIRIGRSRAPAPRTTDKNHRVVARAGPLSEHGWKRALASTTATAPAVMRCTSALLWRTPTPDAGRPVDTSIARLVHLGVHAIEQMSTQQWASLEPRGGRIAVTPLDAIAPSMPSHAIVSDPSHRPLWGGMLLRLEPRNGAEGQGGDQDHQLARSLASSAEALAFGIGAITPWTAPAHDTQRGVLYGTLPTASPPCAWASFCFTIARRGIAHSLDAALIAASRTPKPEASAP